jgi:putative ABC transport system substrate-binding protein
MRALGGADDTVTYDLRFAEGRSERLPDDLRTGASALRLTVVPMELKAADEIERAFAALAKEHVGGVLVLGDRMFTTNQRRIAELAAQHRVPAIYAQSSLVDAGGLMSYGTNFADLQRRAASYVDKILKGAKPADLPVEQSAQLELVMNLKAAAAMGLTIPPSLRLRADRIIE